MSGVRNLLAESWKLVEPRREEFGRYVFARLFLSHPEARELFPVAMDAQHAQLLSAIATTVNLYDDPAALDFYLRALGREHRRYRLTGRHLHVLGLALLDGVRAFGGEGWRPTYDEAWAQAQRLAANTLRARAGDELAGPAYRDAEVVAHRRVSADVAVLTLALEDALPYLPGQYVPVQTPYHPGTWRDFGIANAPRPDHSLDLHVHAVAGGLVSGALVRRTQVGDRLRLATPAGDLTLDRRSTRDIVCVAAGTGLAPVKALIEELVRFNRTRWVSLFLGARDRNGLYDLPAVRRLAARHPWLSLVPVLSDDRGFLGEFGTVAQVVEHYGPWPDHDCFVAGPAVEVGATLRALQRLRVPAERIKCLAYGNGSAEHLESAADPGIVEVAGGTVRVAHGGSVSTSAAA